MVGDARLSLGLREKIGTYTANIDKALLQELEHYSWSKFYAPLSYAIQGGKRIRPIILLLASESVSGESEDPMPASVAVELFHTESMIHDDILDQIEVRRQKTAFHIKYGYGASLLSADFLFGIILDIASRYRTPCVARELSSVALEMCEGEFRELTFNPRTTKLTQDEYLSLVTQKTASLFRTAVKIGGILGGGTEEEVKALSDYGNWLGIAYQINDDIIDWYEKGEQKLDLVWNSQHADPRESLQGLAIEHSTRAKEELKKLKPTAAREYLAELVDFVISN